MPSHERNAEEIERCYIRKVSSVFLLWMFCTGMAHSLKMKKLKKIKLNKCVIPVQKNMIKQLYSLVFRLLTIIHIRSSRILFFSFFFTYLVESFLCDQTRHGLRGGAIYCTLYFVIPLCCYPIVEHQSTKFILYVEDSVYRFFPPGPGPVPFVPSFVLSRF